MEPESESSQFGLCESGTASIFALQASVVSSARSATEEVQDTEIVINLPSSARRLNMTNDENVKTSEEVSMTPRFTAELSPERKEVLPRRLVISSDGLDGQSSLAVLGTTGGGIQDASLILSTIHEDRDVQATKVLPFLVRGDENSSGKVESGFDAMVSESDLDGLATAQYTVLQAIDLVSLPPTQDEYVMESVNARDLPEIPDSEDCPSIPVSPIGSKYVYIEAASPVTLDKHSDEVETALRNALGEAEIEQGTIQSEDVHLPLLNLLSASMGERAAASVTLRNMLEISDSEDSTTSASSVAQEYKLGQIYGTSPTEVGKNIRLLTTAPNLLEVNMPETYLNSTGLTIKSNNQTKPVIGSECVIANDNTVLGTVLESTEPMHLDASEVLSPTQNFICEDADKLPECLFIQQKTENSASVLESFPKVPAPVLAGTLPSKTKDASLVDPRQVESNFTYVTLSQPTNTPPPVSRSKHLQQVKMPSLVLKFDPSDATQEKLSVTGDRSSTSESALPNKGVLLAELKAMKIASIQARNAALEAEIMEKRAELEAVTKELMNPAVETVRKHIKLLHDYNDIRDVGQGLVGMIADTRGVRIGEIYGEFGIDVKD